MSQRPIKIKVKHAIDIFDSRASVMPQLQLLSCVDRQAVSGRETDKPNVFQQKCFQVKGHSEQDKGEYWENR